MTTSTDVPIICCEWLYGPTGRRAGCQITFADGETFSLDEDDAPADLAAFATTYTVASDAEEHHIEFDDFDGDLS